MACDYGALWNVGSAPPDEAFDVLQACTSDPHLWIWSIVGTLVCAGVGALIGKYKNAVLRDAVLGAALGPIGWLISLFLPRQKTWPKCPACQHTVPPDDAHCRYCGAKLHV